METRKRSSFMSVLGNILEASPSKKRKKTTKIESNSSKASKSPRLIKHVDKGWLARCSEVSPSPDSPDKTKSTNGMPEEEKEPGPVNVNGKVTKTKVKDDDGGSGTKKAVFVPAPVALSENSRQTRAKARAELAAATAATDIPSSSSNAPTTEIREAPAAEVVERPEPEVQVAVSPSEDFVDMDIMDKKSKKKRTKLVRNNFNDNFVRINIERKKFMRGKKKTPGWKVKRADWKKRKAFIAKESKLKKSKCRKCGETGHLSMYCMKDLMDKQDTPINIVDSPFPTLEEAAKMALGNKALMSSQVNNTPSTPANVSSISGKEICVYQSGQQESNNVDSKNSAAKLCGPSLEIQPYFHEGAGGIGFKDALKKVLEKFNYSNFRPGQEEAITRVLHGESTLLVLGTGTGKSLCYQLPAYLYAQQNPGVLTLCISPLVSLMEDQVANMPKFINAACLHTQLTTKNKELTLDKIRKRKLDILLISPEALCSGIFGLLRNMEDFPQVAFACIDEVHCISEWSHNFRPSYLSVCNVLKNKLKVKTVLGLTATATNHTCLSVCEHLGISPSSKIQGELLPSNLNLSISRDMEKDAALIELLHGERFKDCGSIIIYCTRRSECDRVGQLVRTCLQSAVKTENKVCEVYHAGLSSSLRKRVQNDFMSGKTRVVIATIAFGMGINKFDIRAVIHYNMPKTFESFVQEIGRAGRDGLPAQCHLFLDSVRGKDMAELKRHIFSNFVDRPTIRRLLTKLLKPCKCGRLEKLKALSDTETEMRTEEEEEVKVRTCCGHEVSFSVEDTTKDLDLPEENIDTLLCYLELDSKRKWIEILPKCYQICKIQSYGGQALLRAKAQNCPPLAAAIALQSRNKKFKTSDLHLEFNLIELAANLGWNSAVVRKQLKNLEWTAIKFDNYGNPTSYRKSGLIVELSDLAFRAVVPGDLSDEDHDYLLNYLHDRCSEQERMQLYQLHKVHHAFQSVSTSNVMEACNSFNKMKSDSLRNFVFDYFNQANAHAPSNWKIESATISADKEHYIRQDIANLLLSYRDTIFSGRAVAKIFQGIESPCFPASDWNRNKQFWRKHLEVDFKTLLRIAGEEVIKKT